MSAGGAAGRGAPGDRTAIREAVPGWSLAPLVTALMALHGIDFIAATALRAIVALDLDELAAIKPPRGFGRD